MCIYHPDISLKYWKKYCLRQSQRNYSIIHPFWISCPFLSSFLHLLLLVFFFLSLKTSDLYCCFFWLAGLSLLVFAIHLFYWLPMHPLVLWFSCSSTSSFMSSLVLPSFRHSFDSNLMLIAVLADISNLKTGFLSQEFYLLHTLCLHIYLYIYTCICIYVTHV